MNTITVGQQHYRWEVRTYTWLRCLECAVFNLIDPLERLYIILPTTDQSTCTQQQVAIWVDAALRNGWYSNTKVFQQYWAGHTPHLLERPYSLYQEQCLVEEITRQHTAQKPSALEKSNLCARWEEVENVLKLSIPTALKQLYLEMGNGGFGPEQGFFLLEDDHQMTRKTLLEAYQELHRANIRDVDWVLPSNFLPFLYWGSDIYSMIDCSTTAAPVYVLDMNLRKNPSKSTAQTYNTWKSCCWQHYTSLIDWLEEWSRDEPSGRALWLDMYRVKGLL